MDKKVQGGNRWMHALDTPNGLIDRQVTLWSLDHPQIIYMCMTFLLEIFFSQLFPCKMPPNLSIYCSIQNSKYLPYPPITCIFLPTPLISGHYWKHMYFFWGGGGIICEWNELKFSSTSIWLFTSYCWFTWETFIKVFSNSVWSKSWKYSTNTGLGVSQ